MNALSGQLLTVIAILAGVGVLAILHALGAEIRNTTYVHDMRVKVATLRKERIERLTKDSEVVEVDAVPEPEADAKKAA